jgi:hypothetical protein
MKPAEAYLTAVGQPAENISDDTIVDDLSFVETAQSWD